MVDPVTLTGLALAGIGGAVGAKALSGGSSSAPAQATPTPPPGTPAPPQTPQDKPKPVQQQSFIGAAAAPPIQSGQKSLLGQ